MHNILNEWDNASKEWTESLKINQVRTSILIPETLKILGDINGKIILDLGCGEVNPGNTRSRHERYLSCISE